MHRVSLKGVVLVLLILSVTYALFFIRPISNTALDCVLLLASDLRITIAFAFGVLVMLLGHVLRAYRGKVLFSKATSTRVRWQFGSFSVGTMCNAILPLKFGELVRADIIAQRYKISWSFSMVLICVERLVDAMLLLFLSVPFFGFYKPLCIIAVLLACIVWVLWASPKWLKRGIAAIGGMLDDSVEARLLFAFWSLEYGLKRTIVPKVIAPYIVLAFLNWLVYIFSFTPILWVAGGLSSLNQVITASVGTFIALTTAATPGALGSFSATLAGFGLADPVVFILLWIVAIVPISFFGICFAILKLRTLPLLRPRMVNKHGDAGNKVSRVEDISGDQLVFLKDYYSGRALARKVAIDEIEGGPAVSRFLTGGGSGAITFLSRDGKGEAVTKVVTSNASRALKQQFAWLQNHANPMVVEALAERDDGDTYSIDIAFEQDCIDAFDYVHACPEADRYKLLDSVVGFLASEVWDFSLHTLQPPENSFERVEQYLAKHVEESLKLAIEAMPSLEKIIQAENIIVNGEECKGVYSLLGEVRRSPVIMRDLQSFNTSPSIHGDLILDNIVWSPVKGHAVLFDPVPCGNCFDGPVFDFGKLSQSLQIGYEFMLRDTSEVEAYPLEDGSFSITYSDHRSAIYEQMWLHVRDTLAPKYLTESERRTMLFIGATNYLRRMKHQAVQCPANALKFYAAGCKFLDKYIQEFECC